MTRRLRGFFRPAPRRNVPYTDTDANWEPNETVSTSTSGATPNRGYTPVVGVDDLDADDLAREFGREFDDEFGEGSDAQRAPSLPIILFSAACGVAGGVIALFVSYRWLQWGIELSAGLATLTLLFSLGVSGAILSAATGSRAAPTNILFSCGVILLAIFFLALCLLVGAIFGTVLVRL